MDKLLPGRSWRLSFSVGTSQGRRQRKCPHVLSGTLEDPGQFPVHAWCFCLLLLCWGWGDSHGKCLLLSLKATFSFNVVLEPANAMLPCFSKLGDLGASPSDCSHESCGARCVVQTFHFSRRNWELGVSSQLLGAVPGVLFVVCVSFHCSCFLSCLMCRNHSFLVFS